MLQHILVDFQLSMTLEEALISSVCLAMWFDQFINMSSGSTILFNL